MVIVICGLAVSCMVYLGMYRCNQLGLEVLAATVLAVVMRLQGISPERYCANSSVRQTA